MRVGIALVVLLAAMACGDDSDAQEDPPTMRRTTAGADIQPRALEPRPASQWCTKHGACCESLLRVPGAGGQPRSCFDLPRVGTDATEPQCSEALGRIVNSLTAR